MNSKEEQLYCVFEKEFLLINQNIKVFIYKDDIMFIMYILRLMRFSIL